MVCADVLYITVFDLTCYSLSVTIGLQWALDRVNTKVGSMATWVHWVNNYTLASFNHVSLIQFRSFWWESHMSLCFSVERFFSNASIVSDLAIALSIFKMSPFLSATPLSPFFSHLSHACSRWKSHIYVVVPRGYINVYYNN